MPTIDLDLADFKASWMLSDQRRALKAQANVSAHAFRRGFAIRWLREGGSETYLRQAAGWRDTRMVGRYVNALAEAEALLEHERIFG